MKNSDIFLTALKAIALGMATATIVLGIMNTVAPQTLFVLMGIGLFALALAALQKPI